MGKRTKARECALQMLYQGDTTHEPMDRVAESFWRVRSTTEETRAMAERLARGTHAQLARIDEAIAAASTNWRFERIAAVDRNILRLATYELMMEPATPSSVVIDEAIEIAKRFGEADSPPFVNGVLDAIKRAVRGGGHEDTANGGGVRLREGMSEGAKAPVPVEGWPVESAQRLEKVAALRALGVNPYPTRYERSHALGEIVSSYGGKTLDELEGLGVAVRIAGRVMLKRPHGKASFATLSDGLTQLQIYVRRDEVGEQGYQVFDLLDLGDFVGVAGKVMRTRKGELSVQAKELTFLSKALLPPPEKWHGLSDVEIRYRQRYVDLMANPEVRRIFAARSAIVSEIRRFLDGRGYVEVETPMMQPIAGGALARPFVTHHNALGMDLYLRIAPELYLKRLVVGGMERVYEINRNFRNEGVSSMHNPEFTMLEFYTAYFDCRDVIDTTESVIAAAAARIVGDEPVRYKGREVPFRVPFARVRMKDAIAKSLSGGDAALRGVSLETLDRAEALDGIIGSEPFRAACGKVGSSWEAYAGLSYGKRIAQLFEDFVEESLWDPTFIVDYPVEISPLSKAREDDPRVADRFELYVAGMEIANGFSELNDPIEQRGRFLEQIQERERGDAEAHRMDDDYIRALGHGLPPTGGCGVGIDRLVMLLTDSPSIRDVILFPQMRPEAGRDAHPDGAKDTEPGRV